MRAHAWSRSCTQRLLFQGAGRSRAFAVCPHSSKRTRRMPNYMFLSGRAEAHETELFRYEMPMKDGSSTRLQLSETISDNYNTCYSTNSFRFIYCFHCLTVSVRVSTKAQDLIMYEV